MPTQAEAIQALRSANLPVDPTVNASDPTKVPRQAANLIGGALGINDAIRALKGEMTPDEQQKFALTAAAGLLPMARIGEAAAPAARAVEEAAPRAYDALQKELGNIMGAMGRGVGASRGNLPSLSQRDIDEALIKNPGASIFDISGVQGPSSAYTPNTGGNYEPLVTVPYKSLGAFPDKVPYGVPPAAQKLNFETPAIHGTRVGEHRWTIPGGPDEDIPVKEVGGLGFAHSQGADALRLPPNELGVHFGTPEQAAGFTLNDLGGGYLPRSYPTVLQTGNSLQLPDLGSWSANKIKRSLSDFNAYGETNYDLPSGRFNTVRNPNAVGLFPEHELENIDSIEDVRKYLDSKGFDSVNYINAIEGPGQRSYIMFKPSAENPDYVGGVRSPFAAFDPAKLGAPGLALGVGGAAAVSPQISEYIQALQSPQGQQ